MRKYITATDYLNHLGLLFLLLSKARREGLFSIENDIDDPQNSKVFTALTPYNADNAVFYRFVCDTLLLVTGGVLSVAEVQRYMCLYQKTLTLASDHKALIGMAENTILAMVEGHAPHIAVEFGRLAIPNDYKPSSQELEAFIRACRKQPEPVLEDLHTQIEKMFTVTRQS